MRILGIILGLSTLVWSSPQCLLEAYPQQVIRASDEVVVMRNGTHLPYQTAQARQSWQEKLDNADLALQFSQEYTPSEVIHPSVYLFDPGRLRYQPFFQAMYGKSEAEVERNLVSIEWPTLKGSKTLRVSKINGVDQKLYLIGQEIARLPFEERVWAEGAVTYAYRTIRNTQRLSMHSFGIAIDLAPSKTQYWQNESINEEAPLHYHNTMPLSIVRIFERHGFIWGGRWYHYDTMHFEYRPELLSPACVGH